MRIDYGVEYFPKGIGERPVSVFAEVLQSRLYKEAEAILQGSMLFLESCDGGLNRFAANHSVNHLEMCYGFFLLIESRSKMFPTRPSQWIIVSLCSLQT